MPVAGDRPVLVALDDAPHAATVLATAARLARTVDAPLLLVHVAEDAVVGDAVGSDPTVLVRADGLDDLRVDTEPLAPVASHDLVGPALADLAAARDARAIVVGSPHGGPLAALARPSADRALFARADRPVIVVPAGMSGSPAVSDGPPPTSGVRTAPLTHEPLVTGRVHDGEGRPVGAVLTLVDADGHQLGRTETDGDGGFGLANPGRGSGLLVVRGRGGGAPAVVSVGLGASATHDVELRDVLAVGGAV